MKNTVEKNFSLSRDGYTLYSNNGDTSKRWFIYHYKELPGGVKKRVRNYGYINKHSSPEQRYKAAVQLLNNILSGEHGHKFEAVKLQNTFSTYFAERCKHLRTKTKFTYQTKVNLFIDYCQKKRIDNLASINKRLAVAFLDSINKSATTKNSYRNTLRTFFEDFRKDKLVAENPFANIPKVPEARRGKFPFSEGQTKQLKAIIEAEAPVLWIGCVLSYYCFIRPGEARMLRVEDVNLDEDFILLHASISKNKKTQAVSIPAALKPILADWLLNQPQNHYIINRGPETVGRDFLNKQHKKILKRLGFSNRFSFYSWKHTGAFAAVKAGIGLKDLQMQMRHHSLDQLNEYLREMGVLESVTLKKNFPAL
jgi:integrase